MEPVTLHQLGSPIVKLTSLPVDNNGCLLVAIHQQATPIASVYHVLRDGSATKIGSSHALGKDDSATAVLFPDGVVRLFVSESDLVAGSSGTTNKVRIYDFQTELRPATDSQTDPVAQSRIDTVARRQRELRQKLAEASETM